MKEKRVSKLLKDIGVILSKENINRVKDGVYFKIVNKNEDGKCNYLLRINEDNKEKEAILEFLNEYGYKSGRLCYENKNKINSEMQNIEYELNRKATSSYHINNDGSVEMNIPLQGICNYPKIDNNSNQFKVKVDDRRENEIGDKERFEYKTKGDKYKIDDVISFIIKAKILKKDPIRLNSELKENSEDLGLYPRTTVYTWQDNIFRIMYTLFRLSEYKAYEFFDEYDYEQVIQFIADIRLEVENSDIDITIKEDFIYRIELFLIYYTEMKNKTEIKDECLDELELNSIEKDSIDKNLSLVDALKKHEEMWVSYASIHKQKLLSVFDDDSGLCNKCLGVLAENSDLFHEIITMIFNDEKKSKDFFSSISKDIKLQTKIIARLIMK